MHNATLGPTYMLTIITTIHNYHLFMSQHLEMCLAKEFSERLWPTVKEPVQLSKSEVTLVIPDESAGWSIIPDKMPCVVSRLWS